DCPPDECARLASAVPPMDGAEYVDGDWVAARWAEINRAFADQIRAHRGPVAAWLHARHPSWHVVGKVCLHLAENRGDEEHPFAFLATYVILAPAEIDVGAASAQDVRRDRPAGAGRRALRESYLWPFGCHIATVAPVGSVMTLIVPMSPT